jgi:hypothetical protein
MNKIFLLVAILFALLGSNQNLHAQTQTRNDSDLVQFTGCVVSLDSSKTIPFVSIRIEGSRRGTYSDMQGYFSFVAKKSDVIVFSCIGFEPRYYKFPSEIKGSKFKTVVTLVEDTFMLSEAVIISHPTPEQLDYMFSRIELPENGYNLAMQNLRQKPLAEMALNMESDGSENARYRFNDYSNKAYYNGQPQPIPVLDIVAWSKFLKSLEKGDLKRK